MIIDNNGKLFGKINAVDFIVIISVLGICLFFYRLNAASEKSITSQKDVILKFYSDDIIAGVADIISKGDNVFDDEKNLFLGEITDIEINNGFSFAYDDDGNAYKALKEGYRELEVTAKAKAQISEAGIFIGRTRYNVGQFFVVRVGGSKYYAQVSGIEIVE